MINQSRNCCCSLYIIFKKTKINWFRFYPFYCQNHSVLYITLIESASHNLDLLCQIYYVSQSERNVNILSLIPECPAKTVKVHFRVLLWSVRIDWQMFVLILRFLILFRNDAVLSWPITRFERLIIWSFSRVEAEKILVQQFNSPAECFHVHQRNSLITDENFDNVAVVLGFYVRFFQCKPV